MNSREIEAAANAWLHRQDVGPWDNTADVEFARWLEESPRHRVAYLRLEHAWERAERLKAVRRPDGEVPARGAGLPQVEEPGMPGSTDSSASLGLADSGAKSCEVSPRQPLTDDRSTRRHRLGTRLVAAASILAISLGALWWGLHLGTTYSTAVGAVESVPIADGSTITLNTATAVRVAFTRDSRSVDLERGEAFFEVAKDAKRPFVVRAGGKRVIAVGTKFTVRRDGEDIRVIVTEGTVRIENDRGAPAARVHLAAAGTVARAGNDDIVLTPVGLSEAEESLSWMRGFLVFHDTTLSEAVAEINRYNAVQVRVEDANAATLPIAGEVRSTNVEAFVRMVEQAYHLRAERSDGTIALWSGSP